MLPCTLKEIWNLFTYFKYEIVRILLLTQIKIFVTTKLALLVLIFFLDWLCTTLFIIKLKNIYKHISYLILKEVTIKMTNFVSFKICLQLLSFNLLYFLIIISYLYIKISFLFLFFKLIFKAFPKLIFKIVPQWACNLQKRNFHLEFIFKIM